MLGCDVRRGPGKSDQPCSRGEIHYCAATVLEHACDLVFKTEERAFGICAHDLIEILLRLFSDSSDRAFNAGVVAGAIKLAIRSDSTRDQGLDFPGTRHVRSCKDGMPALLSD